MIIDLVNGLDNPGCIVYMNNLYTSPILFKVFANLGFGAVGTLDTSRKGVPKVLKIQKVNMSDTCCHRGHGIWIRDGVLVFNLWKDTKVVCTLSTAHKQHSDNRVNRRVKMSGGGVVQVQVPIPNSVNFYNQLMACVDLSDLLIQYHET